MTNNNRNKSSSLDINLLLPGFQFLYPLETSVNLHGFLIISGGKKRESRAVTG